MESWEMDWRARREEVMEDNRLIPRTAQHIRTYNTRNTKLIGEGECLETDCEYPIYTLRPICSDQIN